MSIMSDEVVFKARASVFTHRNSRTRIICNLRRLNDRFTRAGDLDTRILHTAHSHVCNAEIGICNANAHFPRTRDVKTGETRVVNVRRGICRSQPPRRAASDNTPLIRNRLIFVCAIFANSGSRRPRLEPGGKATPAGDFTGEILQNMNNRI